MRISVFVVGAVLAMPSAPLHAQNGSEKMAMQAAMRSTFQYCPDLLSDGKLESDKPGPSQNDPIFRGLKENRALSKHNGDRHWQGIYQNSVVRLSYIAKQNQCSVAVQHRVIFSVASSVHKGLLKRDLKVVKSGTTGGTILQAYEGDIESQTLVRVTMAVNKNDNLAIVRMNLKESQ